jgi:hypothetical protein
MTLPLIIFGVLFGAYAYFFRPRWLGLLGRRVRLVGYAYVLAILISALVRLRWGI